MDGQVAEAVTAAEWLEQQSPARQREMLGPGRAKLLQEGAITVRELTNNRGGVVSLEQLQAS
jgi:hypothetical protein